MRSGLHQLIRVNCSPDDLTHWPRKIWGCNFKNATLKLALLIGTFRASFDKVLRWMIQDLTDDKSTLVQVMVWCRQATSHYLSQGWPRYISPYVAIRPQWVYTETVKLVWVRLKMIWCGIVYLFMGWCKMSKIQVIFYRNVKLWSIIL